MTLPFAKMHGIGNDFVMVNGFTHPIEDPESLAKAICDRRFGVGSDGLIIAAPGKDEEIAMRMWNPDGTESEMCGNGIRCFAHFLRSEGVTNAERIPVETGAGLLETVVQQDGQVSVDMGRPRLTRGAIGMTGPADEQFIDQPMGDWDATAVSMGNPHAVIFVEDASSVDLEEHGPILERHEKFPERVNVHFVQVVSEEELIQRTWERGAGITLACGTGACACVVAAHLNDLTGRSALVHLPGGDLHVDWTDEGWVRMTGPAELSFMGEWHG